MGRVGDSVVVFFYIDRFTVQKNRDLYIESFSFFFSFFLNRFEDPTIFSLPLPVPCATKLRYSSHIQSRVNI